MSRRSALSASPTIRMPSLQTAGRHRSALFRQGGEPWSAGTAHPSDEALAGTYKSLPDDGSADLADAMTPTVD
jgi:hypothetical protein